MSVPKITWHSFDLRSGRRGISLTTQQRGTLKRIIGEATDATIGVSCSNDGAPRPDWDQSTAQGTTMLVALSDESEQIIWGGMVLRRVSDASEWVSVSLMTLEHYFDRRFVSDLGFIDVDQASIAEGLLDGMAVDGLDFIIDAPVSGSLMTRTYADDEDKTVLSALTEMLDADGPEFTVELEWADDDHMQIERIVRVRNRLGTSAAIPTQWTMPGCVKDFELIEDYSADTGANDVLATSSGEGESRPESGHIVAQELLDAGWARFEMRYSPTTSVTSFDQLIAHATAKLADTKDGLSQFTLVANLDAAPRVNVDWWLGDDIEAALVCPRFPESMGPDGELVPGFTRRMRVVGFEIDQEERTLTPDMREIV